MLNFVYGVMTARPGHLVTINKHKVIRRKTRLLCVKCCWCIRWVRWSGGSYVYYNTDLTQIEIRTSYVSSALCSSYIVYSSLRTDEINNAGWILKL